MCEREYVGCPNCGEPADNEMRQRELSTELIQYHLDADGDVTHNIEPDYHGSFDTTDDGYECLACGWTGSHLDSDCTSDHCECDECVEPDPSDEGPDPDRIVALRRMRDGQLPDLNDFPGCPEEVQRVFANRAVTFQPLPRWRAAEIHSSFLGLHEGELPVCVDFGFQIPDEAAYDLLLPGFDPLKPDTYRKERSDGRDVAACA